MGAVPAVILTHRFEYEYVPQSSQIRALRSSQQSLEGLTQTRQYGPGGRLDWIGNRNALGQEKRFTYSYDELNRRKRMDLSDGSHWKYTYDTRNQVTSGKRYWDEPNPANEPYVAGQQFSYAYDSIGNRADEQHGGTKWNAGRWKRSG